MKYVPEHINEKFTQDSDPISDLGIGIYVKRDFKSSKKMCEFILEALPAILKTSEIPDDIVFLPKYREGAFHWKYYYKLNHYIKKYLTVNGAEKSMNSSCNDQSVCRYLWDKLLEMGYPKVHQTKNVDHPSYRNII